MAGCGAREREGGDWACLPLSLGICLAQARNARRSISSASGLDPCLAAQQPGRLNPNTTRKRTAPEDYSLTMYVSLTTYLLMATTGLGYLAVTWSTVVLLGGFVTLLQRKDFWSITVISMMLAARIFNELGDELVPTFSSQLIRWNRGVVSGVRKLLARRTIDLRFMFPVALHLVALPFVAVCYIVVFLYGNSGRSVCKGLALWRIVQRDYGSNYGDATNKANLAPALDMFYGFILCQGVIYLIWLYFHSVEREILIRTAQHCFKWPRQWLVGYLFDIERKCWRDTASIKGRSISRYAVDLIDSGYWKDNLSGARILATFIRDGADIRWLLLPSRPRIQKLIDTLGWRAAVSREMRQAATSIVAHLAGDIRLSQLPGAIRCISTLLLQDDATVGYDDAADDKTVGGCNCNQMILQGLTILERLASDHLNCMDLCTTPGLLPNIMAPLCSSTLIQGIKNTAWADIVNGSLKVLYSLMRCPDPTGTSLRREISANQQAISNLESILSQSNEAWQDLQMRAMEILTELALDVSINLTGETKQSLMKKQLQIFLDKESDHMDISKQLRATAGRTLASSLSISSEVNCAMVNDHFVQLTEILHAKNNITYRIIAAQILENICVHCDLDKDRVKDTLLPQVLKGILSTENEQPRTDQENKIKSAPVDDVENQNKCAPGNSDGNHNVSAQVDIAEIKEISSTTDQNKSSDERNNEQRATSELQESLSDQNNSSDQGIQVSFLSLTLVIYDKLISTDDFDDAVQKQGQGSAEFVVKLKTIVEENCKETVISLRIVKLCGQIAASMMSHNQYTEQFKIRGFVEALSKAKENLSNLESCILFARTELGRKKISMPLLSELGEKVIELVG